MVSIPFSSRIFNTQSCELLKTEDEMHKKRDEMKTENELLRLIVFLWQGNLISPCLNPRVDIRPYQWTRKEAKQWFWKRE